MPSARLSVMFTFFILSFIGCSHQPPVTPVVGYSPDIGEKAAVTALSMVGKPYKFEGDSPQGFDCSGLVQYSYLTAGLEVPHGTSALRSVSRPLGKNLLQKGDLLFFNERGKKFSHVGMYIGGNSFVHAPSSGKKVRKDNLTDPYWKKSFIEARRFPE